MHPKRSEEAPVGEPALVAPALEGADVEPKDVERSLWQAHARTRLDEAPVLGVLLAALAGVVGVSLGPLAAVSWAGALAASLIPVLLVARHALRHGPARDLILASEALHGLAWAGTGLMVVWPGAEPGLAGPLFATALIGMALNMVAGRHHRLLIALTVAPPALAGTLALAALNGWAPPFLPLVLAGTGIALIRLGIDMAAIEAERIRDRLAAEAEARSERAERLKSDLLRWQAERSNHAKTHFLATMSHELRTPLNAILGFAEVLKSELLGAHTVRQYRDYAGDIHHSGQHLLNLINELLDLSRIEAGRYELCEEPIHLADIAEDCRRIVEMRARSRGIFLKLRIDDLPPVRGDERALRQVLINLCSNAVKFTPAGGSIDVRVSASADGGQLIAVRDTGPGMSADELAAVREARRLGPIAERRPEQGAGLGLGIVMRIMALHQGRFDIFSREGVGTEAIVTFPRQRVLAEPAPALARAS